MHLIGNLYLWVTLFRAVASLSAFPVRQLSLEWGPDLGCVVVVYFFHSDCTELKGLSVTVEMVVYPSPDLCFSIITSLTCSFFWKSISYCGTIQREGYLSLQINLRWVIYTFLTQVESNTLWLVEEMYCTRANLGFQLQRVWIPFYFIFLIWFPPSHTLHMGCQHEDITKGT